MKVKDLFSIIDKGLHYMIYVSFTDRYFTLIDGDELISTDELMFEDDTYELGVFSYDKFISMFGEFIVMKVGHNQFSESINIYIYE